LKEKSFERKAELIEAALDEFTTKKYEEASLNSIIKGAGISKGTFYYHFQDKQQLYLYLLEYCVKVKWDFISSRVSQSNESFAEKDIFEQFKLQARIGAEFAAVYPKYHLLGKMFSKEKDNEIYQAAKKVLGNDSEKLLEKMIDTAISKGDFRKDFPRDFIIKTIHHMFMSFDEIFYNEEDFVLEKMIQNLDHYVDFLKHGLENKS